MNHTILNDSRPMRILFAVGMMLFTIAHHCQAQILISDVFSGTNTASTSLVDSAVVGVGNTATAPVGPGYDGTLWVGVSAIYSETMTINPTGAPGTFSVSGSGVVAALGTFDASRTFTGTELAAATTYTFTLTDAAGSNLGLLSGLNVTMTQGGTTVLNTSTGVGLLNGVAESVTSMFTGNTATITFTTPTVLSTTLPLVFDINGGTAVGLIGNSFELTGGSIQAVPEPSTWALLMAGVVMLGMVYFKRVPGMARVRVRE